MSILGIKRGFPQRQVMSRNEYEEELPEFYVILVNNGDDPVSIGDVSVNGYVPVATSQPFVVPVGGQKVLPMPDEFYNQFVYYIPATEEQGVFNVGSTPQTVTWNGEEWTIA
jgi:hypothetical protein